MTPDRDWLVARFISNLSSQEIDRFCSVLVLGGGLSEPELQAGKFLLSNTSFAGIENESNNLKFYTLDLNLKSEISQKFDLVICNQVLEHLYNPKMAFDNIRNLVKSGGYVWLTAPSSNFRHGSPDFFSAGYAKEFLSVHMTTNGFKQIDLGELSNKRIYFFRHLLKIWPSNRQLRFPLFSYFGIEGSIFTKIRFNLCTLLTRILLSLSSSKMFLDGPYPIETFGLFQRPKSVD